MSVEMTCWIASKRHTKFGYFVIQKEAKLFSDEIPGVEEGKHGEYFRCNSLPETLVVIRG